MTAYRASFVTLCMLGSLIGCAGGSIRTTTSSDPAADLGRYRTYAIESHSQLPDHITSQIATSLGNALDRKGWRTGEPADLTVRFYTIVDNELTAGDGTDPVLYRRREGYTEWNTYDVDLRTVSQGTLIVDVVDESARRLVWEGQASGLVDRDNMDLTRRRIDTAVERLVAQFPASASPDRD